MSRLLGQRRGKRNEVSLPEECLCWEEALLRVRVAYEFFRFLQISQWFVPGRRSATWNCMSLLSLGSSEAPEVLPLSTASAITSITFARLSASLEIQLFGSGFFGLYSHFPLVITNSLLVSDSLLQYSSAQNSGWTSTSVRAFQNLPPFPISQLEVISISPQFVYLLSPSNQFLLGTHYEHW